MSTHTEHLDSVRKRYDSNLATNNIEAMEYIVGGVPLTEDYYRRVILDPIIAKLELEAHHRALDVGCGAGLLLKQIETRVHAAEGFDISENMV